MGKINKMYLTEPVSLLIDEPVGTVEEDILNIKPFADVIAGAALGTPGPFTIGVYADWGEGKTSVLRLAKELVEKNDDEIVTVWFNAWQYGKEDHPIVPLVATIAKAVTDKLKTVNKNKKKIIAGLSKLSTSLRAIAYGFSAKGKISVPGFGELEAGFVAKEMIDRYDQLQKGDDPLIEKTLYYNAFEMLESIAKNSGKNITTPRIAVFIDDLDRCNPPEAIKLLESIKLVLSQKGFVFTLALDERILQGFLKYRYLEEFKVSDYENGGKDYLDKIIQLPLPLLPHEKRFTGYIDKLLENNKALNDPSNRPIKMVISDLKDVLSKGAKFNPRNLVRFLNNLIVDRLLWKMVGSGIQADAKVLGICVVSRILRDHFKDKRLYEFLWRNQDVCYKIRNFVVRGKTEEKSERFSEYKKGFETDGRPPKVDQIMTKLRNMEFLQDVLRSRLGKDWLDNKDDLRITVNQFIAEQREEVEYPLYQDDDLMFDESIKFAAQPPEGVITEEDYQRIESLDLGCNYSAYLPERIGKLTNLKRLDLSNNAFAELPEAIGKLTKLKTLRLDCTPIENLSETLVKLTNLTKLSLNDNHLNHLPEVIGKLVNLEVLYLKDNMLTDLPEVIGKLTALKALYLQGNYINDENKAKIKGLLPPDCDIYF